MVWIFFSVYLSKDRTYHFSYFEVLGEERFKNHPLPFPQMRMCLCTRMPYADRAQRGL